MPAALKIALLTTDNREHYRDYSHPEPYFGTAIQALLPGFAGLPELEVDVISCLHEPVDSPERIAPNIRYHSLVVPTWGWLRTGYLGCVHAVRQRLAEVRPDLAHGQGTERDCALEAVFSGYKNVVTVHGVMTAIARQAGARFPQFYWFQSRLETLALRRTDGVFCNSAYTEEQVQGRSRRTWRVPNALQLEFFSPLPPTSLPEKPSLLCIGVVCGYKRQIEILRVAEELHREGVEFTLQFIGALGGDSRYARDFTEKLRAAERLGYARHLGLLKVPELIAALDAAQALVHFPSEESFGLVVPEALARGKKVFVARTGGLPDIVAGIESVDLMANDRFDLLKDAIKAWIKSGCPAPTDTRDVIRARYHPSVVAQQHLAIYREVLDR